MFVAVVALALSGCGGGGGGTMSILDDWQRFEAGDPTLRMSSASIEQAYASRSRSASHDLLRTLQSVCDPGTDDCGAPSSIAVEVERHEHQEWQLPAGGTVVPVLTRNGVPITRTKARVIEEVDDPGETEPAAVVLTDIVTYGGWLDHTVFGVVFAAECLVDASGCSGTSPVYAGGLVASATPFGVYPGSTPAGIGSAAWTGVMVGMESPKLEDFENEAAALAWLNAGPPDVYLGDARIEIDDLAAPEVDVSFTNIHNVTEGARHRDLSWEGLSVGNGLFGAGDSGEYIAGMFTGPRHQEVGGEFRRDGIEGGFGAKRP